VVLASIKYYRGNKNTRPLCLERAKGHRRAGGDTSPSIDTCVGLKSATGDSGFYEEISVETLCRAKWPLRFVPEIKTERVGTGERREEGTRGGDQKRGRHKAGGWEKEREEGTTPVMVHEKTNSVILFGRRAKPSVWRHIFPLSLISSPSLLVSPPSPPTPIKEIKFRIDSRA